ncbi:MAG TPA: hypothetical protein VGS12_00665 [Caulobacteraceae bacterium]|nr:hypothetical protein [Caulobacteraceae bacterium]
MRAPAAAAAGRYAILCVASAAFLAACQTAPAPVIVTKDVNLPVAAPCAADPGPDPIYVDTASALAAAADLFERVKLLLAGREQRIAREGELKAALSGCSSLGASPPIPVTGHAPGL